MPDTSARTLKELWHMAPRYRAMQRRREERGRAYRAFLADLQPVCEQATEHIPTIHVPLIPAPEQRTTEPLRLHRIHLCKEVTDEQNPAIFPAS